MKTPLELTFKHFKDDDGSVEKLIREKVSKLEKLCDRIVGCHVFVEQMANIQHSGHSYHVRISLTIPPHHELVVKSDPPKGGQSHEPLSIVLRDAFNSIKRQIEKIAEQQKSRHKPQRTPLKEISATTDWETDQE